MAFKPGDVVVSICPYQKGITGRVVSPKEVGLSSDFLNCNYGPPYEVVVETHSENGLDYSPYRSYELELITGKAMVDAVLMLRYRD